MTAALGAAPKTKPLPPEPTPILPAEPAWSLLLDSPPAAAGVIDADRVYVALQGGGVRAFDRETGAPLWSSDLATAVPPVVSGSHVFVAAPEGIVALAAATGTRGWTHPLASPPSAPFASHDGALVVTTQEAEAIAIRETDGAVLWRRALRSPTKQPAATMRRADSRDAPAAAYGVVLALDDSRVVAIDVKTGEPLWERSVPGTLSAPATARDRVLVGSTNNFLYALDSGSGREVWRWRTGGDVIGAAAAGDRIYFASLDNILRAVNRDNGNQQWKTEIPTRPSAPPIAVGDVVLTAGVAPRLDGFVGKTGEALGSYAAPTDLQGVPAIDPDLQPFRVTMVVFTRDGHLTALRPTRMMLPDPPLAPFQTLPGRELAPEKIPNKPTTNSQTSQLPNKPTPNSQTSQLPTPKQANSQLTNLGSWYLGLCVIRSW